ncbi:ThiS family protein [Enterobacter hormaechei subsp. xiangfangensis]|nr:ThiS family protein [Enterobacter hormaechei subsp. xiangfangensis]
MAKSGGKSGDFKEKAMIKVFFAQVRELVNTDSLTLDGSFENVAALRAHLAAQGAVGAALVNLARIQLAGRADEGRVPEKA